MHGLGNDFMVIDNRAGTHDLSSARIRAWADRHTGIGFDQATTQPSRLPGSHRGIEDSIIGRVRRAGGTSVIESKPGVGTEVEISVPRVSV